MVKLLEELKSRFEVLFYYLSVASTFPTAYVYWFIGFISETKIIHGYEEGSGETEDLSNKVWLYYDKILVVKIERKKER